MRQKVDSHDGRLAEVSLPETLPADGRQFIEFSLINTAAGSPD